MNRSDLREGQKVVVTRNQDEVGIAGLTGRVLRVPNRTNIPVEFEDQFWGAHDCNGRGAAGYCYYVSPENLSPVTEYRQTTVRPVQTQVHINICPKAKENSMKTVLRKVTTFLKRVLDENTKAQYQLGWVEVDRDDLVPTQKGAEEFLRFMMIENKVSAEAFGKYAQDKVKDVEKAEKKKKSSDEE